MTFEATFARQALGGNRSGGNGKIEVGSVTGDVVDVPRAVDDHRHFAGEEGVLFTLEAALVELGVAGVAAAGSGQRLRKVGEEEDGQVGLQIVADFSVKVEDDL